jgi:glucan phosphoethanolaminetransferase (alkaline phosphatase superfamily)
MAKLLQSRALALCAIALLIALLMLPNLVWLVYSHTLTTWIEALLLPAVLLTILFAFLGRWLWLACLLLAPFALLAPLEIFYVSYYRAPSTPTVIATIFTTNAPEVRQYFGSLIVLFAAAALGALVVSLSAAWASFHTGMRWRGRVRERIAILAILVPAIGFSIAVANATGPLRQKLATAWVPVASLVPLVQSGYPFGVFGRALAYRREWVAMRTNALKFRDFSFHAHRVQSAPTRRQVYVLVIGESSAREHWHLFGYSRATNPNLSRLRNLVPITRMVSAFPETIAAVPVMLTRKPVTDAHPEWHEPSFLPALQEAGYQTWWISNQYPIGPFDSPVAVYAYEAEHVLWLNRSADSHDVGNVDGDLIQPLRRVIASGPENLFIVLHMMGSHRKYDYRYPSGFAHWEPTQLSPTGDGNPFERPRNSYDNSIRYSDYVLAQVIDVLKHSGAITALWYESDHGEVLPTPECHKEGHDLGTWHEFEIPAFFWYSDGYRQAFPERVAAVHANANRRTLSGDTFESMIDMSGVTFPGHNEAWSLFSPEWRYHTRWVTGVWRTDFDHSMFGKQCGVVLPESDHPNPT